MAETRAPKRKDYARIALDAAQASLTTQTAAHVAVLEAADDVTDADTALTAAHAHHEQAVRAHAGTVAAFATLVGPDEAATRLGLTAAQLRTLLKPPGKTGRTTPTTVPATADPAAPDGDDRPGLARPADGQTAA